MIKEGRGRTPKTAVYVVFGNLLMHQPTGLSVEMTSKEHDHVREAKRRLQRLIAAQEKPNDA